MLPPFPWHRALPQRRPHSFWGATAPRTPPSFSTSSHPHRVSQEGYIQTKGNNDIPSSPVCNWKGLLKDLNAHLLNDCIFKESKCKFYKIGCKVMVNNKNKEKHEKEDMAIHLGLAIDELQATKDLAESVRKENTQIKEELNRVERGSKEVGNSSSQQFTKLREERALGKEEVR